LKNDGKPDLPTADETRTALDLVLASEAFRASPQLAAFLKFVVKAVLEAKDDRIKSHTIAIEVLRRPLSFDPQTDPTVRVEATRLRRALERYYAGPGQSDAIVIELPRGSYVPTFTYRAKDKDYQIERQAGRATIPRGFWMAGGSVLAAAAVGAWFVLSERGTGNNLTDDWPTSAAQLRPGNGMPTLAVPNFETIGTPRDNTVSAAALRQKMRDAFSRFETINVPADSKKLSQSVDYRLLGFVDYPAESGGRIRLSLLDVADGNVAWTQTFMPLPGEAREALENRIAFEAATMILQPSGVIRARDYNRFLVGGRGDARYRCLLITSDAFRSFYPDAHERARRCLERLIAIDPGFGIGYSYLAGVYNQEWGFGFGKAGDDPGALDVALTLARRGVELGPDSARAWHILSTVLFNRHDTPAAIAAMQKSMSLNPFDTIVATDYGGRLVSIGEIERGMTYLERYAGVGGVRPIWQHFYLFLGNYMRDKLPEATREADEMTSDIYTFGLFARTLTAAGNGNTKKARANWEKLIALRPVWRENPRSALERFISSPAILDRLTRDLAAAGLEPAR
jgi:tetratricopeptide (TPR) repeat protein